MTQQILPGAGGGPSVNIYNSDGTLTADRTLDGNNNDLTLENLAEMGISVDDLFAIISNELRIATPEVVATNAIVGQVLTLINATTGESEWTNGGNTGVGGSGAYCYDYDNLTPVSWSVNQNNIAQPVPPSTGFRVLLPSGDVDLTGIIAPISGCAVFLFFNVSSFTVTVRHNSGLSSVGNRFICPDLTDYTIHAGSSMYIRYDYGLAAWHLIDGSKSS